MHRKKPRTPIPPKRRLRGYAFDPSLSIETETSFINEIVFEIDWEGYEEKPLYPGPIGEYLEVIDYDPSTGCFYDPIDLNAPYILAQDGLDPAEGDPQFHQQMVYAVGMTTIQNFEKALGRWAMWSPRVIESDSKKENKRVFIQRLRVYPHAIRQANAFYSSRKKALLFGYFPADPAGADVYIPGGTVFTCLSHDIIAHEITHALLDGMNQHFIEPVHRDNLAFHEAFSDIVALLQHFSFPEVLRHQIAKTRGDLSSENLLGQLAQQFGLAIGNYGALRTAIGTEDPETGEWKLIKPDPQDYERLTSPHERGSILVGAIFDAFLAIYNKRVADFKRIASKGTGILEEGELHPDLVNRLAKEASKTAQHILTMCIRALDYCPPNEISFGDYLRAIITADFDLVPDDRLGYRVAFIEAFKRRGIYPRNVRSLSVDSLRWKMPNEMEFSDTAYAGQGEQFQQLIESLREEIIKGPLISNRREAFAFNERLAYLFKEAIKVYLPDNRWFSEVSGLDLNRKATKQEAAAKGLQCEYVYPSSTDNYEPGKVYSEPGEAYYLPTFEVHSVRLSSRTGPTGNSLDQLILVISQEKSNQFEAVDRELKFRGGVTLIIDWKNLSLKYAIRRGIDDKQRMDEQKVYLNSIEARRQANPYFGEDPEQFRALHLKSS